MVVDVVGSGVVVDVVGSGVVVVVVVGNIICEIDIAHVPPHILLESPSQGESQLNSSIWG